MVVNLVHTLGFYIETYSMHKIHTQLQTTNYPTYGMDILLSMVQLCPSHSKPYSLHPSHPISYDHALVTPLIGLYNFANSIQSREEMERIKTNEMEEIEEEQQNQG